MATAVTHTLLQQVTGAGRTVQKSNDYSGDGEVNRSVDVPDSSTDKLMNIAIDVSQIKLIYIVSDQAMLIETNADDGSVDVITLVANQPYIWKTGDYFTNLLTTDVTCFYLTNSSGSAAVLDVLVVTDSTP